MFSRIIFSILIFFIACTSTYASELSAKAVVESTEVYAGETFAFQIQVFGSESPEQPDLSGWKGIRVQFLGGSQNSSSSITIINGKMTRNEKKGYVFSYHLTAEKTGTLVIPSIEIRSGNDTVQTNPLVIIARKPAETDDFKLRLQLSKETCYVGEPITLTVTWYIGKNVNNFNLDLPVIHDTRFEFAAPEIDQNSGKKLYRIPLGGSEVIGEQGQKSLDGKRFTTISFKKVLIPVESGSIPIDPATLTCSAQTGYSRRSDDPVSSFFDDDFFGSSRRAVYKRVVVPSNKLTLRVRELPIEGRPANFKGHIGNYKIETSASPVEVNVGDPITLTVTVKGPEYLEHVELPPLNDQSAFTGRFKIPDERASAETKGNSKIFTQTIRPLSPDVDEIPPVKLPYFDTKKGEYRIAKSAPIPLSVKETKVLTLLDAEGKSDITITGNDIETWGKGIAFNYEDMSVLEKQYLTPLSCFTSGPWPYLVFCPPLLFVILLVCTSINRKRNDDPLKVLSRKAFGNLQKAFKDTESAPPDRACEMVLDIFREYLGVKLRLPSGGAITFADARQKLESIGIEQDIIENLKEMFESCEAARYAGNITFKDSSSFINKAAGIAADLEKRLK
ncbi:MAG: BatD family protein [Desulfobacteraceae bacterium]|jgi:hypothetical protein